MYRKILVPLDGSKLAEGVLPHVQALAKGLGSEVVLIRAVMPLSTGATAAVGLEAAAEAAKAERDQARSHLHSVVQRLKAEGLSVRAEVVEGEAGDAIIDYSRRHEMDLIAMSTHGRGGLRRLVYGSVADHVLRHAGTPVLLIRSLEERT